MAARTVVPEIASFKSLVGKELGPSEWIEVSQERIKGGAVHASLHLVFEAEGEKRPAAFGDVLVVLYP